MPINTCKDCSKEVRERMQKRFNGNCWDNCPIGISNKKKRQAEKSERNKTKELNNFIFSVNNRIHKDYLKLKKSGR